MFAQYAVSRTLDHNCHVTVYQFQDLATLFGANIPGQTNANMYTTQPQQMAI